MRAKLVELVAVKPKDRECPWRVDVGHIRGEIFGEWCQATMKIVSPHLQPIRISLVRE